MRLRLPALALVLATLAARGASGADGDQPPAPPAKAPGDKPAKPPEPPRDPVQEQLFADKGAEDALAIAQKGSIADVMEGIARIAKLRSAKVTARLCDLVLGRREMHVAEFAGCALALCDADGVLAEMKARLSAKPPSGAAALQTIGVLSELPAEAAAPLLADRFLKSANDAVRRETIRALGWQRSPLVVDAAIFALGSRDPGLRNVACVALGRVGDRRAIPALLGKLDERDGGTSGFAAIALGRIEDDKVFGEVAGRIGVGDSVAAGKALVACARPAHAARLAGMLAGSTDAKIAACAALAKIRDHDLKMQQTLLDLMLGDSSRWVRVAAFHALSQCATADLAPSLSHRMGQKDDEKKRYVFELAGDLAAKDCVGHVEDAMWTEKNDVLRRIAIDAFWRIHDTDSITAAEDKIRRAEGRGLERAAEVLALRNNLNGFNLALELLGKFKPGSREGFLIELTLEKQTGHFFGSEIQVWKDWFAKNPKFFEKEQAAVERDKWREEFLKENKGPKVAPATEESVQAALDYLARHQAPDGAFDQQHFLDLCEEPECPTAAGARIQTDAVGTSALCALAYFGAGANPARGRYRGVLARAMDYLLSRQMPSGDYAENDLIGGYNRPLTLQAYAEAALASGYANNEYVPFVQRGVDFIASIQADKAGWRYRVVDNASDTSVVAWVLFASKAAEKAHAKVRRSVYEGADLVFSRCQVRPTEREKREDFIVNLDPNYGFDVSANQPYYEFWTGYQDSRFTRNQSCTVLGLMSRILLGYRRSHPFCIGSANKILAAQMPQLPKKAGAFGGFNLDYQYPMYFLYYGTLSMHQMGGKFFREWDKALRELLPGTQLKSGCEAGSWASWGFDRDFGRLYTTAIGALTLETYYRYAPVLQD